MSKLNLGAQNSWQIFKLSSLDDFVRWRKNTLMRNLFRDLELACCEGRWAFFSSLTTPLRASQWHGCSPTYRADGLCGLAFARDTCSKTHLRIPAHNVLPQSGSDAGSSRRSNSVLLMIDTALSLKASPSRPEIEQKSDVLQWD